MKITRRLRDQATLGVRPRRTLRLRLTVLYGGLFLISGAALLGVIYVAVEQTTELPRPPATTSTPSVPRSGVTPADGRQPGDGSVAIPPGSGNGGMIKMEMRGQADAIKARAKVLHQLLVWSVVALGTMAVLSVALGWIMAGRMLRPLRTITATARSISATSLHRRLDLDSPEDELKELGDTFDDLLSRLEASFQAQRQFVANASHELRSPLARQRTVGQVAILDPDATVASLRAAHEAILRAGAQQEKILEALLTLSRGQAGIDVHEPFDLAVLATEVIDARRTEAHALGISLSGSCATAAASGHARLAQQLVTNLVDNALRHNHEDGRVEVRTSLVEGRATLTVSNTGPVVPESAVERLFQPFQRLGTARTGHGKAAGFGLGLSIVQAIAKAHDATISTLTQPAGGLAITVTFPPVPAGVPPAPRTPSARPATDETLPKPLLP